MLNPNSRANTVISQSFIASEFQGYSDPFNKAEPTSSLNQFVRSKQTSDSGFIQDGENQSFGFGNITANHEPKQLESFSRKANEVVQINVTPADEGRNRARLESYDDESGQSTQPQASSQQQQYQQQQYQQAQQYQQQYQQNMQVPQQLNERYVSPNVMKGDSPTKPGQYNQVPQGQVSGQRAPQQQQFMTPQAAYNQPSTNSDSYNNPKYNQQQSQQSQQSQQQQSQKSFSSNTRPESSFTTQPNPNQYSQLGSSQLGSSQLGSSQLNSSQLSGSRPTQSNTLEGSSVGKRLKLNVSQEFSNSFVLKCVNEPQKSSILSMKQRQR